MSWSDHFPILTDEQVLHFEDSASLEERCALNNLFAGRRLASRHGCLHLICLTLSPELPPPSRFLSAFSPPGSWSNLNKCIPAEISILLQNTTRRLASERPEVGLRIYLDPVWAESADGLLEMGCDVILMAGASAGPNPASLWRFLALEEDLTVTFLSLADLGHMDVFIERSAALGPSGMKLWRSPMDRRLNYRPIDPDRFGSIQARPVRDLLCAFTWHVKRGQGPRESSSVEGTKETQPLQAERERKADWGGPDLAEFFLMSAIYPRAAFDGMLSLIEAHQQHSTWQLLDIEYANWSNADSEILFVKPIHQSLQIRPVNFKESTLIPSMFERLMLENSYPEHFEAWQQARVPGNEVNLAEAFQPPKAIRDGKSSTRETP